MQGLSTEIIYGNQSNKFTNVNFIQTVSANGPNESCSKDEGGSEYDKRFTDSRTNLYYAESDEKTHSSNRIDNPDVTRADGTIKFYDDPARELKYDCTWTATVSIVGVQGGAYQIIGTFTYGFEINNGVFSIPSSYGLHGIRELPTTPSSHYTGLPH